MLQASTTRTRPFLTSVAAHLYVRDIQASVDFFTRKLGFNSDFTYGEPPFYAQVSRDNVLLALRHVDESVYDEEIRRREDLLSASITLATAQGLDQIFQEFRAAAVPFHQALRTEPWGAKTFIVSDLDGNLILFAAPAS